MEDLNRSIEEETSLLREQFATLLAQGGYVGQDTVYEILRSDDRLFTVRFVTTVNLGGSGEFARCLTLDHATGQIDGKIHRSKFLTGRYLCRSWIS